MWCKFDFRPHSDTLKLWGQDIEHGLSGDESGSAKGDTELIARSVIIATYLARTLRNADSIKSCYLGRSKLVECCILMPTIETSDAFRFVFVRNTRLVECSMARVL